MKKIMSMAIVLIALVTLSVSTFAADNGNQISESTFQENVVVKVSNAGKFMKEEEEFEILTPEEISSMEETEDPDALLEVCPKCGKIHDGCCAEEAERIHFRHYVDTDYSYLKFCDLKDNALYFVTLDNNLMLMNLKTKQLYFIAIFSFSLSSSPVPPSTTPSCFKTATTVPKKHLQSNPKFIFSMYSPSSLALTGIAISSRPLICARPVSPGRTPFAPYLSRSAIRSS